MQFQGPLRSVYVAFEAFSSARARPKRMLQLWPRAEDFAWAWAFSASRGGLLQVSRVGVLALAIGLGLHQDVLLNFCPYRLVSYVWSLP